MEKKCKERKCKTKKITTSTSTSIIKIQPGRKRKYTPSIINYLPTFLETEIVDIIEEYYLTPMDRSILPYIIGKEAKQLSITTNKIYGKDKTKHPKQLALLNKYGLECYKNGDNVGFDWCYVRGFDNIKEVTLEMCAKDDWYRLSLFYENGVFRNFIPAHINIAVGYGHRKTARYLCDKVRGNGCELFARYVIRSGWEEVVKPLIISLPGINKIHAIRGACETRNINYVNWIATLLHPVPANAWILASHLIYRQMLKRGGRYKDRRSYNMIKHCTSKMTVNERKGVKDAMRHLPKKKVSLKINVNKYREEQRIKHIDVLDKQSVRDHINNYTYNLIIPCLWNIIDSYYYPPIHTNIEHYGLIAYDIDCIDAFTYITRYGDIDSSLLAPLCGAKGDIKTMEIYIHRAHNPIDWMKVIKCAINNRQREFIEKYVRKTIRREQDKKKVIKELINYAEKSVPNDAKLCEINQVREIAVSIRRNLSLPGIK